MVRDRLMESAIGEVLATLPAAEMEALFLGVSDWPAAHILPEVEKIDAQRLRGFRQLHYGFYQPDARRCHVLPVGLRPRRRVELPPCRTEQGQDLGVPEHRPAAGRPRR